MTTLITGAGGFVGSHLAERLNKTGEDVDYLVYDKSNNFLDESKFNCIKGDITDRQFVKKTVRDYDRIYHLAALLNYTSPTLHDFMKVNVEGTRNIMDAALNSGVKKVVYASSRVTINEEGSGRVNENHIHKDFFDNAYALSKHRGEKIVFEYGARGIDVVTIHPTLIYGPREMHTTGPLIKSYLQQRIRFVGFLKSRFNLVYVHDIVDGLIGAMKKGKSGHRYILGGEEVSIEKFLSILDEIANVQKITIQLPNWFIEAFIGYVAPTLKIFGVKLPVSKNQIYAMRTDTLVDISKAKKDLGLKVTPLRKGLNETLKWYKENNYITF